MSDTRELENPDESEFGMGRGMIDPRMRADRALEPYMEGWEIKALPKTFDGSMPARSTQETTPVPKEPNA